MGIFQLALESLQVRQLLAWSLQLLVDAVPMISPLSPILRTSVRSRMLAARRLLDSVVLITTSSLLASSPTSASLPLALSATMPPQTTASRTARQHASWAGASQAAWTAPSQRRMTSPHAQDSPLAPPHHAWTNSLLDLLGLVPIFWIFEFLCFCPCFVGRLCMPGAGFLEVRSPVK